MEGAIVL